MEQLQNNINKNFKSLWLASSIIGFSLLLLMIRIKLSKTFFLLFLVWNVFLAIIPYAITMYLNTTKVNKFKLIFWFGIWVLFLPNAPYLITDLKHIRLADSHFFWLDILVLFSFAIVGLVLFFLSVKDMQNIVKKRFKKLPIHLITNCLFFLCGFGMYLGRELRYNSWEIISNPKVLIADITDIIISPFQNAEALLFTLCFGIFLRVGYCIFFNLTIKNY